MIQNFVQLLDYALTIKGRRVGVIFPDNAETLSAITQAATLNLAHFILIGESPLLQQAVKEHQGNGQSLVHVARKTPQEALDAAIELVRTGACDILMKGSIDSSLMMKTLLREEAGIRTGRLLSDIFLLEFPQREENKFVLITDGGMTLAPDLKNKVELINNAVEVAHALGNLNPKVAVLSATEMVVPTLSSTIDAAALSKMNERGQIKGCVVDGPLALDNAISLEAAQEKRINSPVAGRAEILIAANIESANSLAKSTTYFAGLRLAHVIVGGRVPILIPSRADKSEAKLLSIALGVIMHESDQKKSD